MAVKVTGQFAPAGSFSIVDGKDVSGHITGSNISASGTITANAFSGDGSALSGVISATSISGSFTAPSASISTRLTTAESELGNTLISGSAQIASDISGSWQGHLSSSRVTFGGDIYAKGNVIAQNYIVSSSVTHMTQSFSSGSTIFGDTTDDTHVFVGNTISGSSTSTGSFGALRVDDTSFNVSADRVGVGTSPVATSKMHIYGQELFLRCLHFL